ncbi:hypothetical protein ACHWQZ_G019197 [Mnemiopsis leidyi]
MPLKHTDWITVDRGVKITYELENSPLQIQTDSEVGSNELIQVWFFTGGNLEVGGVTLHLTPPHYDLIHCSTSGASFSADLPSSPIKVWTISLTRTSGIRLRVHCNDVEVFNVVISNSLCASDVYQRWERKPVEKILFHHDTASDYYRQAICTELERDWTMETTTQFPVNFKTVVVVTCSDSNAVKGGSGEVTCIGGTDYTFLTEPQCSIPDLVVAFSIASISDCTWMTDQFWYSGILFMQNARTYTNISTLHID